MGFRTLATILILSLTGCGTEEEPQRIYEAPPSQAAEESATVVTPHAPPEPSDVRARADLIAERLVAAINEKRPESIARLSAIPPEVPSASAGRAALDDYRRYFGENRVDRAERLAETGNEPQLGRDGAWEYRLIGADGTTKHVRVYYDARLDTFRAVDEFLMYSGRVHRYADAVVTALRHEDALELASLLSVDDLNYPVELAEQAIRNYNARFDPGTLEANFIGLAPPGPTPAHRPFLYDISGTLDGAPASHTISVITGDGLVGWDDSLIPLYQGV